MPLWSESTDHSKNTHRSVHENLFFECEQCTYKASQKGNLKVHVQVKHCQLKVKCTVCREIVRNGYLKEHLESNHLGMKYSCHECELEARSKQQLRRHVEKKHLGITYRCDECDYQTRAKEDLWVHVKVKHLGFKYTCV